MITSTIRTKHIEVPSDTFELPVARTHGEASLTGVNGGSTIAKSISGTPGNDDLNGTDESDVIDGGDGDDVITDYEGNNRLFGGNGRDKLTAGSGRDYLDGGPGNDKLEGFEAGDTLSGGDGNDKLYGAEGRNILTGGSGKDTFVFEFDFGGADRITDFKAVDDTIHLDRGLFETVAKGRLSPGAFVIGSAARDDEDRIIYNKKTGILYYDPDGLGGASAKAFAVNDKKSAMSYADFFGV